MSYLTVATCAGDPDIGARVRACYSQEGADASSLSIDLLWLVASRPDIEAAYAAALAAGTERPGADEAAVTDQMILSAVQANMPAP